MKQKHLHSLTSSVAGILTFMLRNDGFRVQIDDVQNNMVGLYLYCKNYDALEKPGCQPNAGHS